MKRTLLLSILSLSLTCGALSAKEITTEQARQTATQFWQSTPTTRGGVAPSWQLVRHSESSATRSSGTAPAYYVFANANGPGFVIVAGDDVAMPVLGYSFENEFPSGNLPANLQEWLDGIREEVNYARNNRLQAESSVSQAWAATRAGTPVVEMETALWDQGAPFNKYCPTTSGGDACYTGCTATALAIIMRYHEWPNQGSGTLEGYTTNNTYSIPVPSITLGHTYDWANMKMQYKPGFYLDRDTGPVATLMRDCAVMINAQFSPWATSAPLELIPGNLTAHMNYDGQVRCIYRWAYTTTEWNDLMKNELNNNRPILYSGYGENGGGHAFVLDGYTEDDYYSINWGWNGSCNGYYLLTALNPTGQGIGGGSSNYNYNHTVVIGMQKNTGSGAVEEIRFCKSGNSYFGLNCSSTIVTGQPFNMQVGLFYNSGSTTVTNKQVKLVVTDRDGNVIQELATWYFTLNPRGTAQAPTSTFTITEPIYPGYRIRAYYQNSITSQWEVVRGNEEEGYVWDLLIDDEYNIEETTQATFDRKTRVLQLQVKEGVTTTLQTTGGSDYTGQCQISGQTVRINTSQLPAGNYRLILQKRNDRKELLFSVSAQ